MSLKIILTFAKFVTKDAQPNMSMNDMFYKTTKITTQNLVALNVRNLMFPSKFC